MVIIGLRLTATCDLKEFKTLDFIYWHKISHQKTAFFSQDFLKILGKNTEFLKSS